MFSHTSALLFSIAILPAFSMVFFLFPLPLSKSAAFRHFLKEINGFHPVFLCFVPFTPLSKYDILLEITQEDNHMKGRSQNIWVLILLLLAGVVLGGFLAQLLSGYPALSWLGYGKSFGLTSPLVLDLGVLTLQFAFTVRFTIAGILGIVLAFFIYRKI